MDKKTQAFIDALYKNINRMYTVNHACLKALARANQEKTIEANTFSGSEWLRDKLSILANQRARYINQITHSVANLNENGFYDSMKMFKTDFMKTFEQFYGASGTFEDCFDGYEIKHEQFKKDYYVLDMQNRVAHNSQVFQLICYNYISYLEYYKQMKIYEAYQEIFTALCDDLNSEGYKTFSFQKPQGGVTLISDQEIQEMHYKATSFKKRSDVSYKTALKKRDKSYRKCTSKKATDKTKADYSYFYVCFEHECNQNNYINELHHLTKSLMDRMKSANTPSNTTLKNTLYENFYDFMSGVNVFSSNNNYQTDKVYIHQNEMEYYEYLLAKVEHLKQMQIIKINPNKTPEQKQ